MFMTEAAFCFTLFITSISLVENVRLVAQLFSYLRHDDDPIFFYSPKGCGVYCGRVLEMSLLVSLVMNSMMELKAIA